MITSMLQGLSRQGRGRREPRDVVGSLMIHERHLPLGAVIWAASAKDPGLSPEGIMAEIRRNARCLQADYDRLEIETPVDAGVTARAPHWTRPTCLSGRCQPVRRDCRSSRTGSPCNRTLNILGAT